jgi:ABC-2 type transport system permease protein
MRKIILIIQREYLTRIRKKAFWILTFLAPVIMVAFVVLPFLLDKVSSKMQEVAVVDQSGLFAGHLQNTDKLHFQYLNSAIDSVKHNYKQLGFGGVLFVPQTFSVDSNLNAQYYSDQQLSLSTQSDISDQLTAVVRKIKLQHANLTEAAISKLSEEVTINTTTLGENGEHKTNSGVATFIAYFTGIVLYIILLLYGTMVMRGVAEEKVNRIAEVIISSVTPFQLMIGKIVGVALVGLTQFIIWIALVSAINIFGGQYVKMNASPQQQIAQSMNDRMNGTTQIHAQQNTDVFSQINNYRNDFNQLPLGLIAFCFVFYFLTGYLLYAALFAAIGSAMGDEPGDQSMSFIVTFPIILSFFIMITVLDQPNSSLAVGASIFPLSAPIVMLARIPFGVPAWQIIASMISVIIGFLLTTWLAAKIYRVGILLYGKKSSLKEIVKWVRY